MFILVVVIGEAATNDQFGRHFSIRLSVWARQIPT